MRTQQFIKVFNRVVRLLGQDPLTKVPQDAARSVLDHINERVETIWNAWDWPEWTLIEERAFRQIWNDQHQYLKVSVLDGLPDEVYYIPTETYYKVNADAVSNPPIGTTPADTDFWEEMDSPMYNYISYDQTCRRAIGRVTGIYRTDPRMNCGCGLSYHPSPAGLDVRGVSGATVFIQHIMPTPVYTIIPFVLGRTYHRADTVFDPNTGECFQALDTTTTAPNNLAVWRWIPFLDKWATFVVQGAFADCQGELDQGGNSELQAKMILASRAETKAMEALQTRIDELTIQGQTLKWGFCKPNGHWHETLPFSGGTVSTLSADCEDELGWVFPLPGPGPIPNPIPDPMTINLTYRPDIVSLKLADPNLINEQLTTSLSPGSMVMIYTGQLFRLDEGAADDDDPGQGIPCDFDSVTNDVHWIEVG